MPPEAWLGQVVLSRWLGLGRFLRDFKDGGCKLQRLSKVYKRIELSGSMGVSW